MIEIIEKYKDIVKTYQIISWDSEPLNYRFKAHIYFINNSTLIIKDYLFTNGRKYSFQWQDVHGNLIIRWDNAYHWKDIETFPHHRHEKNNVFPSKEFTLEDVMAYICKSIIERTK
jgi:hypothetical protein